jgi:hypothetical protein
MDEQQYTYNGDGDSNCRWLQVAFGVLLLTMGIASVMWILYSLTNLTTSPHNVPVIAEFTSLDKHASIKLLSDTAIQLPDGIFYTAGFLLYLLALGIVGSLAKVLLSTGTRLLEPDIRPLLARLREVKMFKEFSSHHIR